MSGTWEQHRKEIRRRIARDGLDDFLSWSVIQATMWVGDAEFVQDELKVVSHLCKEYGIDTSDTNAIHQLYHLYQWLNAQEDGISKLAGMSRIIEIGGGYGSMAEVVHALGFKGDYLIYDYPELRIIQDYYLDKKGITVGSAYPPFRGDMLIACFSLSEMDIYERERLVWSMSFDHRLIAYAHAWDGISNDGYFAGWGTVINHPNLRNIAYSVR